MNKIVTIILLGISLSAFSAEKHNFVPVEFQGKWSAELKYCKIDNVNNLIIFKNKMEYWESNGPILAVVTKAKNEVAFISELSGEGDVWISFSHYSLSPDHMKLTDIADPYDKNKLVRFRCK